MPPEAQQTEAEKLKQGTPMLVGSHSVVIDRYISAGGFASIYAVKMGEMELCLKRVLVQSKEGLNQLRGEVEVMQRLANTKNIVKYLDSNAQRLNDGQYEVLVLMELCSKSLLDYMNERLTSKLTEIEIVKIMGDVSLAVYGMHVMKLIHRDIKIENVLIDKKGKFKLCDFGSTCPILRVPQTSQEFQLLHNDLMRQTTPQYRAPEMIDLYRGNPIDEKGDIWALGVFLYKLCYYTTPFETVGELGILHSVYSFPSAPPNFSLGLKKLISLMLQENPQYRPNIYQVIMELNKLGTSVIIDDYYGLGEYRYPPKEQMFDKLEPFVASKVPMYQPFRQIPIVPEIPIVQSGNSRSRNTSRVNTGASNQLEINTGISLQKVNSNFQTPPTRTSTHNSIGEVIPDEYSMVPPTVPKQTVETPSIPKGQTIVTPIIQIDQLQSPEASGSKIGLDELDPFSLKRPLSRTSSIGSATSVRSAASVGSAAVSFGGIEDVEDRFPKLKTDQLDSLIIQLSGGSNLLVDLDLSDEGEINGKE